jgi:hypothetical protein
MSAGVFPLHPDVAGRDEASRPLDSVRSRAFFGVGACVLVGAAAGLGPKTGAAAVLAVGLALVVLRRPAIGAFMLVLVVPAASGLRRGLPVPGFRLSELLIAAVAGLILLTARPGQTPRWRTFDWLALGYVVATAVFGFVDLKSRGEAGAATDFNKLLGPLQFFLLYRAILTALDSADQRRTALRLILLGSIPVSLLAILQQAHIADVPGIVANITGSQAYLETEGTPRATGPFAHWHDLGGYLFVIVLLGVAVLVGGSRRVLSARVLIGIVVLAAVALINTVSFTPIAGAIIGCVLVTRLADRPQRWVGAVAVSLAVVVLTFAPLIASRYQQQFGAHPPVKQYAYLPQNVNFRIDVWTNQYFPVVREHLATGYGPDHPPSIPFSHTETIYLTLLLRGGVPLLIIYAGLMFALALLGREVRRDPDPDRKAIGSVLFLTVALGVFMQLLTNYFVNAGFPHLLWVLAALLFIEGNRREDPEALTPARTA